MKTGSGIFCAPRFRWTHHNSVSDYFFPDSVKKLYGGGGLAVG